MKIRWTATLWDDTTHMPVRLEKPGYSSNYYGEGGDPGEALSALRKMVEAERDEKVQEATDAQAYAALVLATEGLGL